jgi:PAS domain S-box-containing protein
MHGKTRPGVRYDARLPFLQNDRTLRLERLWRFERDVARARAQVGLSAERALDWLVMLSLARDWSQGLEPDVAATTAAVELPRTTVKRSLDGLAERDAVTLYRCKKDGRRRLIRPGPHFAEIFDPLLAKVADIMDSARETSESLARRMIAVMSEPVLVTDAPSPGNAPVIIAANTAFTRLTGYTEEEVLGKSPEMLQGEDTETGPKTRIRQAIDRRKGGSATLVNYRKNGTAYDCELTISPIRDEEGAVQLFMGIARSVGEHGLACGEPSEIGPGEPAVTRRSA